MTYKQNDTRYAMMMAEAERQIIGTSIEFGGSVAEAAEYLGVDKTYLYRRMRLLNIPTPTKASRRNDTSDEPDETPETEETTADSSITDAGDEAS
jgi:hypothetical protein